MPRVICSLPNASHMINGVRFASMGDGGGMLSEEIADHIAEGFLAIRGYQLHEMPNPNPHDTRSSSAKNAAAKAAAATE